MPDLARLRADDDMLERDAHALLSRLVQVLDARLHLRRDVPSPDMRQRDEATASTAIDRIFAHLIETCERRILLREQIDAAASQGGTRPQGGATMH